MANKWMLMEDLREILVFLSFFLGAFKSTPEGRARRAAIRLHRRKERWRKARLKYAKELRKDVTEKRITPEQYKELIAQYDKDYPKPE